MRIPSSGKTLIGILLWNLYTPISTSGEGQGEDRSTSGVAGGGDALGPDDVSPVRTFVTTPAVKASG